MQNRNSNQSARKVRGITLKSVAEHVGLTPSTVSAVLNNSAAARSVPERTKQRILAASRELNYRPNYLARSLRVQRTYTIGVIARDVGDAYGAIIISGIERYLRQHSFFFLAVAHHNDKKLLNTYSHILLQRGVEGLISMDTLLEESFPLPTIAIAGHRRLEGVTNIVLDHHRAATLALQHLAELGHREIAFMRGPHYSSDSVERWKAIQQVAADLGIVVRPELTMQLEGDLSTPEVAYPATKLFLRTQKRPFTALFAFNDNSALGAISALQEAGLHVPNDISVVGFDDIKMAPYINPSLTTVRQPLQKMGEIAARSLLNQIKNSEEYVPEILIEPEFVVRKSTAKARLQPVGFGETLNGDK
ncbi:MAG: LacI family DNA-binding transcriptional regulator [Candidatus Acidiferrales bacterium]